MPLTEIRPPGPYKDFLQDHHKPMRILMVEDSIVQAEILRRTLSKHGFIVEHAQNGLEGLAKAKADRPDLVISDVNMPEMSGFELCRAIRREEVLKDLPIILLTTLSNLEDVLEGLEAGAFNFITKPYNEERLLTVVAYQLRKLKDPEPRDNNGLLITCAGQQYTIREKPEKILDFFLSTYSIAVEKNLELAKAQEELERDITERQRVETELKQSNEYLEKVFDGSAEGIGIADPKGLIRKWNKVAEEIYGYAFKEVEGKPASDLYADKDELAKMLRQLRQDGYVKNYEIQMKRKGGGTFPCSLGIKVLRDEKGKNLGSVTVIRDLTEFKEKEAKLRTANEQLQALVTESNQRNRYMSLLQEMSEVFQSCRTSEEAYSAIPHLVPRFFPDYAGALYIPNSSKNLYEMMSSWGDAPSMERAFSNDECWSLRRSRANLVYDSGDMMNCRHVSNSLPGSYLCLPMMAQGEILGIFHLQKATPESKDQIQVVGQFASTVAEAMAMALANLKLRETLRSQAIRDDLTGLFNRHYLEETLERELSRTKRSGAPLGVIMLDLDHFKEYNDTFGYNAGDELLRALGQLIQDYVRQEDIACRVGGEEFLLIMPGVSLETALKRANALNLGVKQLHHQSSSLRVITISAGVAIFPDHGANGKDVIRAADAALYRAKAEGRDRGGGGKFGPFNCRVMVR